MGKINLSFSFFLKKKYSIWMHICNGIYNECTYVQIQLYTCVCDNKGSDKI